LKTIRIKQPGILATVQDTGRFGCQHQGVPVSGAMDSYALRLGNLLVGNSENDAGIEITLGGFKAEFMSDAGFAVTGPEKTVLLNGISVPTWTFHRAFVGDILQIDCTSGVRNYLCISGGIDVPMVLGSKSTYLRGKFGGFDGRALQAGDEIGCGRSSGRFISQIPQQFIPLYSENPELRVIPGPQDDRITKKGLSDFLNTPYRISNKADRMGYRLEGSAIELISGADIISDGIALGSVQVPGDGQPIIHLADRATTGGYVKIATIASFDISLIAQALPGQEVRFRQIGIDEARQIYLAREFRLHSSIKTAFNG